MLLGGGLAGASVARAAERTVEERDAGGAGRGNFHDVREYGAVGDGRTQDTCAIQRAIDVAHRRGAAVHGS